MSKTICPGQDTRFWKPEDIFEVSCSSCGATVEFFKDEGQRRCTVCGARIKNPKLAMGCAQWCEHAKECLGFDPKEIKMESEEETSLADKLVEAVKNELAGNQKRLTHSLEVLEEAQSLMRDFDVSPKVVIAAALLHEVDANTAESKYTGRIRENTARETTEVAERIMKKVDLDPDTIEKVCRIIGCFHDEEDNASTEAKILWDADTFVNLSGEYDEIDPEKLDKYINKAFKTALARKKARSVFIEKAVG